MNRLGDTSAFVIPAGQLLLTRRGKTRMYTVGIVFEFYSAPLKQCFTTVDDSLFQIQKRFIVNMPTFKVKVVDNSGVHRLPDIIATQKA